MFIKSKFLTGEVRITEIKTTEGGIQVIGTIKDMYPMEVTLDPQDIMDSIKNSLSPDLLLKSFRMTLSGLLKEIS